MTTAGLQTHDVPVEGVRDVMTIGRLVESMAERRGDEPFLLFEDQTVSFAQLSGRTNRAANSLWEWGVRPGDTVCVMMNNAPEYLYAWFGLAKIGAGLVPINVHLRGDVLAYILHHCDAAILIVHPDLLPPYLAVAGQASNIKKVVVCGPETPDTLNLARAMAEAPEERSFDLCEDPDALAGILYTSGTTGPSKGVMLGHYSYLNTGRAFIEQIGGASLQDVLYTCLPLFHCNAQQLSVMGGLMAGTRVALSPKFSASGFWKEIRRHRATVFNYLGAILTIIYKQPERPDDADNPARLTLGGAAPKEIWRDFERRFDVRIVEAFGLTETATFSHCNPLASVRVGSVGKPLAHFEAKIVDEDDRPVPPGTPGEIVIRGVDDRVWMSGYYKMPEKTAEAMRGGWFHTGDRGTMDADGYFYFLDRAKDCIRRRGENISSFEVEQILNKHPLIQESAAVGVPSELTEEDVMAVIVLRPGAELSPEAVVDYCLDQMAYFMAPAYVKFVDALPKTPTQRVQKYRLREEGVEDSWNREAAGYKMRRRK